MVLLSETQKNGKMNIVFLLLTGCKYRNNMPTIQSKIKTLTTFLEDEEGNACMIRLDDPDKASIMAGMLSVLKEAVPIEPIEGIKVKLRTDKK